MKALIALNELFTHTWVASWKQENNQWVPDVINSVENCQRVAEVEPDNKVFEVHNTLIWVDCPDDCVADQWYYKNGVCTPKTKDVPHPNTPVPETSFGGEPGVIA
jgi:hypothetical protein